MAENAISWFQQHDSWLKMTAHGGLATSLTGTRLQALAAQAEKNKSIQFKALLFHRPNPRYSFKIFIAMQQDYTMLYCDLGDATIYRAVDGDSLSP